MSKKSIIMAVLILVIGIIIAGLYGTFAASNTVSENSGDYDITLTNMAETVTVPAGESKTVMYRITNTNKGTVQYGVAYSGTNITIKVYSDSTAKETDFIDYGENKFVKLYIENSSTASSTVIIKTVLGYENGGTLDKVIPTGYTLVTEQYTA